jgi:hypothetical protein
MPKVSLIFVLCLILSEAILCVYTPQQTYAMSVGETIELGTAVIGLAQSLFGLYDTAKSHMTPQH